MKRLLCIVGKMDAGGAETFLMKIYRSLDTDQYQMDFCVTVEGKCFYDDEIIIRGGKIYRITQKTDNLFAFISELRSVIKNGKYERVLRVGADCFCMLDLWIAFFCGVKIRAFRSSNAGITQNNILSMIHKLFRVPLGLVANVKIAPSKLAAQFTFGKKYVEKNKILFLHNGIDYNIFKFDINKRNRIRKELNVNDYFVIGHIGRFNIQKNHPYLLKIFNEVQKTKPNIKLILVGKGELENEINNFIQEFRLEEKVTLLGIRNDIPDLLSGFDMILFPSLFEGMPNVIVEAQAAGLPCIISDTITDEANITGLVKYVSLENETNWIEEVNSIIDHPYRKINTKDDFKKSHYEINDVVKVFVQNLFENN